jgi:hypothetical protein
MREVLFTLGALLLASACQPAPPPSGATAGSTEAGAAPDEEIEFETEALVGVWSFDRSCASGDGMTLVADGTASFDEWGQGTWATADGNRVVLTLTRWEPGVGPTDETVVYNIDLAATVTDDLIGLLARADGSEPRGLNALRCLDKPG